MRVSDEQNRGCIERGIAFAAPALDLLLRIGDAISRRAEPVDHEYYPVRALADPDEDPVPGSLGG